MRTRTALFGLLLFLCSSLLFLKDSPTSATASLLRRARTKQQQGGLMPLFSWPAGASSLIFGCSALALLLLLRRRRGGLAKAKTPPSRAVVAAAAEVHSPAEGGRGLRQVRGGEEEILGRESEIAQLVETLAKRTRSNALLVGKSGSGKTAIIEGLARRIGSGQVPEFLKNKKLVELDMAQVLAGTKYRGEFEEKLLTLLHGLVERRGEIILVLDDIHTLIGAGNTQETGGTDAAGILRPLLARNEIQIIGTTTPQACMHLEKDKNFARLFNRIHISDCDQELSKQIVQQHANRIAEFHKIRVSSDAVETALLLTDRFLANLPSPDRTVDVLDSAAARVKLNGGAEVSEGDVRSVISAKTKIPLDKIGVGKVVNLKELERNLRNSVIGQSEAIDVIMKAVARAQTGLKPPGLPMASFLFAGQSGVGKTEVARQLAKHYFNKDLIRLDMSEFMEAHAISRLIGTSAGYVGYGEGGNLTEAVKHNPHSLILLDEVEKAHPKVFDLFLQVMGDGRLTDGRGEVVDFKNVIIIMTTNIGAQHGTNKSLIEADLAKFFRPEFRNRLDDVVIFNPLTPADLGKIYDLIVNETAERLRENFKIRTLRTSDALKQFVIQRGHDPKFGARPLRRAVQRVIDDTLAEFALISPLFGEDELELDLENTSVLVRDSAKRVLYSRSVA